MFIILKYQIAVEKKTAKSLRFCSLLPSQHLVVGADTLDMKRPIFTNAPINTLISSPEYTELDYVCKFLRAFEAKKFLPGDAADAEWNPWLDKPLTPQEAFKILTQYTAPDGQASYIIFYNFLRFMYSAFMGVQQYPVFASVVLSSTPGLESLKHVFCELLIETSKDFTLRSVPRGSQYRDEEKKGPRSQQTAAAPAAAAAAAHGDGGRPLPPSGPRPAQGGAQGGAQGHQARRSSHISALAEIEQAEIHALPPLIRQLSHEMADRFAKMRTW